MVNILRDVPINYSLVSFIIRSKYRTRILWHLSRGITTPSLLAENAQIRINHVSNLLREMQEKKLVKCINPEEKKGRIYELTELGHSLLNEISKMEGVFESLEKDRER